MRRQAILLLTVTWLMLGAVVAPTSRAWADSEAATLKSVSLSAAPTGAQVVLRVEGAYSYKTVQASPDTLFIDLAGAKADGVARSEEWTNSVFSGYKLLSFKDASGQPVVRVQVNTKADIPLVLAKEGSRLRLLEKGQTVMAAAVPAAAPAPVPAASNPASSEAPSSGPILVSNVTLDKRDSDETFVDVATSRNVTYRVSTLPNPSRLIVDIEGALKTCKQGSYAADTSVLKDVRVGQLRADQQSSIVRVVADLNGNPAFDVHSTPDGVRIELRPHGAVAKAAHLDAPAPAPQPKAAEVRPAATPEVKPVQASVAPSPKLKPIEAKTIAAVAEPKPVEIKIAAPAQQPKPQEAKVTAPVSSPAPVETKSPVNAEVQSTLPAIATTEQAAAAPLPPPASVTPEALRAKDAAQTLRHDLVKDAAPAAGQAAVPGGTVAPTDESKPVYTGEPISVNFKDVDIKDFFREIHEISGLNIIIDPNVSGSVTLVLDSVPWDQALDIVLKNNGLGRTMEGNVLRIARLSTLTGEQQDQQKLADARINAAPMVTIFRPINYAKAQDIATLLKTWSGGGALSKRGTVLVDARNNTLIVSDIQSQIPIIENIVTKIDKKAKQISIEARVVLATADFTRTLNAALSGTGFNHSGSTTFGMSTGSSATITPTNTVPNSTAPLSGLDIPANATAGFGTFAVTNASQRYLINAVISAQEERDQAKTISRPTIVTQNNVQGSVQQGVQVPVQTSINNTISVQYENATLQMQVTPQVTDDNNIFLIINVNNASLGASISTAGPNINTQQATTSVLVPDGGTVVFGGITVTSRTKSATYIPLLGNIPVLGHLFKSSNVQDNDQELLFFVSPKILPS
jgi:type IV pilus assembly protein PilQ